MYVYSDINIDIDIYIKSVHLCLCTCLLPMPPPLVVNCLTAELVNFGPQCGDDAISARTGAIPLLKHTSAQALLGLHYTLTGHNHAF